MSFTKKFLHAILASLIVTLMSATMVYAVTTISGSSITGASGTLSSLTVSGDATIDSDTLFVDSTNNRVGIGTTTPQYKLDVNGDINIASNYGYKINGATIVTASSTLYSLYVGDSAGNSTSSGLLNTFIGYKSGFSNTSGYQNTALGYYALEANTTGDTNTAIGVNVLSSNINGTRNTSLGMFSMFDNTSGSYNLSAGTSAGLSNTTGSNNVNLGSSANYWNQTGSNNVIIGIEAGIGTDYHNKSGDVFLGYRAGYYETGSNKLYISNSSTNDLVYGDFSAGTLGLGGTSASSSPKLYINSTGNVGIATSTPVAKLEVNGSLKTGSTTVSTINYADDSSSNDTYVMTLNPPIYAYTKGMMITFIANTANTGACTINVNGLGAKALKIRLNQDPTDGYIAAGSVVVAVYDGTNFQMIQPAANAVSGDLSVTENVSVADRTVVPGVADTRLGSFTLTAGSDEGVNVTSIVVTLSSANAASITSMYLKNNATSAQIGSTINSVSTTNTYTVNFDIALSNSLVVDIYGTVSGAAGEGAWIANPSASGTGLVSFNSISGGSTSNPIQTITIANGVLAAANGTHPSSAIVLAGSTGNSVAQFTFSALYEGFTVSQLKLKIGNDFATSTSAVTVSYNDSAGDPQTSSVVFTTGSQADATSTFTGLTFYVPANGSASINISLDMVSLSSGGHSGAVGAVSLDYNEGFLATGDSGAATTTVGSTDLTGNNFYNRKSKPTFAKLDAGTDPTSKLYRFSVLADNAGNIDLKQLSFTISTITCDVSSLYLYEPIGGTQLTTTPVTPTWNGSGGDVKLLIGDINDNVLTIGTSATTYEVRGTVSGYGSNDMISISFKQDTAAGLTTSAYTAGADGAANVANKYNIWSDRSAGAHTTVTADWTNGYLLSDMSTAQNFSQ